MNTSVLVTGINIYQKPRHSPDSNPILNRSCLHTRRIIKYVNICSSETKLQEALPQDWTISPQKHANTIHWGNKEKWMAKL